METGRGHGKRSGGRAARELGRALAAAEALCSEMDEELTPPRRRVFELLLATGAPAKVYELIGAYQPGARAVAPTTVYRALAFLERMGLVHRLESLNAYIACQDGRHGHAAGFLICESCGAAREFEPDLASAAAAACAAGYSLNRITTEARGLCPACR
jgi:Fur family zinc uptake transcriptional regulator